MIHNIFMNFSRKFRVHHYYVLSKIVSQCTFSYDVINNKKWSQFYALFPHLPSYDLKNSNPDSKIQIFFTEKNRQIEGTYELFC